MGCPSYCAGLKQRKPEGFAKFYVMELSIFRGINDRKQKLYVVNLLGLQSKSNFEIARKDRKDC